jgi:hypothetical protein
MARVAGPRESWLAAVAAIEWPRQQRRHWRRGPRRPPVDDALPGSTGSRRGRGIRLATRAAGVDAAAAAGDADGEDERKRASDRHGSCADFAMRQGTQSGPASEAFEQRPFGGQPALASTAVHFSKQVPSVPGFCIASV